MPWVNTTSGEVLSDPLLSTKTGISIKTEPVRMRLKYLIALKLVQGLWWLVCQLFRFWWVTAPMIAAGAVWWRYGWPTALTAVVTAVGLVVIWWRSRRDSFMRWLAYPYKARVRRLKLNRRWAKTMVSAGLAVQFRGDQLIPVLRRVQCRAWQDVVTVRMVAGQIPQDFSQVSPRFAHAFRVRMVKVGYGKRQDEVLLHLMHGDPLARMVKPLAVTAIPDFTALPLGVQENGDPFTVRLLGNQILGVGTTDAGKGSIAWSFIRSLAGGVAAGLVRLWVFDPKGGMELAAGVPMFDRFFCDEPAKMAETLELAAQELRARATRLRGKTRQHTPTLDEPLTVIVIDELAAMTAYADRNIKDRIKQSLGLILTQGRAVGFHVLAFVQDPRKEVLPFRDLFTVRIGLRMSEAEQVDLVLGDGARDRGALCDRISQHTPGVGYVVLAGQPTPVRVRMSYLDDDDIAAMVATYPRAGVVNGQVIPEQTGASIGLVVNR